MSKEKDGGPAFPQHYTDRGNGIHPGCDYGEGGMTLRDWFAGQALKGWFSSCVDPTREAVAQSCYRMADIMLAERGK